MMYRKLFQDKMGGKDGLPCLMRDNLCIVWAKSIVWHKKYSPGGDIQFGATDFHRIYLNCSTSEQDQRDIPVISYWLTSIGVKHETCKNEFNYLTIYIPKEEIKEESGYIPYYQRIPYT